MQQVLHRAGIIIDKSTPFLIYGTGLFTLLALTVLHTGHHHAEAQSWGALSSCSSIGRTIEIRVERAGFTPANLSANRCDVVVFIDADTKAHYPAFGVEQDHQAVAGFIEKIISPGQTNSVLLERTGTYSFHDHFAENHFGTLTVR